MQCPSVKKLLEAFPMHLDEGKAKLIRKLAHSVDDADQLRQIIDTQCPKTAQYVRSLYNSPYSSHIWRVTVALYAIDVILDTCGVEALGPGDPGEGYAPPYEYLNAGDPYLRTLIYCRKSDRLFIGCWGDIAEKHPNW